MKNEQIRNRATAEAIIEQISATESYLKKMRQAVDTKMGMVNMREAAGLSFKIQESMDMTNNLLVRFL